MGGSRKNDEEMLLKAIQHYQDGLVRYMERNDESKMLHSLNKLSSYPIRLCHLQETGVGRTVNTLVKVGGKVGELAKSLIAKWKQMVEEEKEAQSQHDSSNSEESPKSHNKDKSGERYSKREKPQSSSEEDDSSDENQHKSVKLEAEKENRGTRDKHDSSNSRKHKSSHNDRDKYRTDSEHSSRHEKDHSSRHKKEHSSRHSKKEEGRESSKKREGKSPKEKDEGRRHKKEDSIKKNNEHREKERDESPEKDKKSQKEKTSKHHKEKDRKNKTSVEKDKGKKSSNISNSKEEKIPSSKHYKTEISSESGTSFADALGMMGMPRKEKKDSTPSSRHSKEKMSLVPPKIENKLDKKDHKSEISSESGTSFADALGMMGLPKKEKKSDKKERTSSSKQEKTEISSESGTSFGDALGMVELPKRDKKSVKRRRNEGEERTEAGCEDIEINANSGTSFEDALGMVEAPKRKKKLADRPVVRSVSPVENGSPVLPLPSEPLEKLDLLSSLLPSITPNYRPIRITDSQSFSELDTFSVMVKHKNLRTKIYSGNKSVFTKVPSLFDICVQLLQVHIDAIEGTGGVPYSILKPVLEKATPAQLYRLEYYNSYLTEDSDELWKLHCQKSFWDKKREECETWREMFTRCTEERDTRLMTITANIKQSRQMSTPVRTTKLAYIDPPSAGSRRPTKHSAAPMAKAKIVSMVKESRAAADVEVSHQRRAGRTSSSTPRPSQAKVVKKVAPLMAKSLSAFKNRRYK